MINGVVEALSPEQKYHYLRLHSSHPMGFLTLQPGFVEFHMEGIGYVSFARHLGSNLVLGDPICAPENMRLLLGQMLRQVKQPTFIQISRPCALLLGERFGYKINCFGQETDLPLQDYTLTGNKKNNLRYAIRQGRKVAVVKELTMRQLHDDYQTGKAELDEIFASWMKTRKARHQLKFMVRPVVFADEPDVRKFYALDEAGQVLGFVFFSPLYKDGKVFGYYNDVAAAVQSAPTGLATYITLEALKIFQEEKLESLNLGISPLSRLERIDGMPKPSWLVWAMLSLFYRTGNHLYNFQGAYEHKRRYRGRDYPVFIATKWKLKALELSLMSHYIGILEVKNLPVIKQIYDFWR